jgi:ketosteroid isomerase-like protein
MDQRGFESLLATIAAAWSSGDSRAAAECFTEDVVYLEPPDRQRYVGRTAVYELSGGDEPGPMSMVWHHVAFDTDGQVGFGEYTFRGRRQFHGIAVMQVRSGRISRWREYQYHDETEWTDFVGDSGFSAGSGD